MTTATNANSAVELPTDTGLDDAGSAFLARLLPEGDDDASKKKPSDNAVETTNDEHVEETPNDEKPDPQDQGDDGDGGSDTKTDDKAGDKKYVEDDAVYTKVKVGDEEHEVPVKDLKRLYGQEAALTRKSQEFAKQRETVTQQQQQYVAGLNMMAQRAEARANQYRQIDFMALARNPEIDQQQLNALQLEAQQALQEETFFKTELTNVVQQAQKAQQEAMVNMARETVKEVADQASPHYIEGFNQKVYGEMVSFAKQEGINPQVAENIVDAPTLKLLHMAMMYKQGAKAQTKQVVKTPKKIVKTPNAPITPETGKGANAQAAMKKLKTSGKQEDAEAAFLARWEAAE